MIIVLIIVIILFEDNSSVDEVRAKAPLPFTSYTRINPIILDGDLLGDLITYPLYRLHHIQG